ncbi:MAG: 50S ribosomal protein L7/L12 [Ilumatobacteraceae bacterium]|nr:50S ribosomal protein L7/L12 [Ilumatobacteraceae bacterium]
MATKDDILESISNMTVIELKELLDAFEEKFEVTAAAPVAVAAAGAPAAGGGDADGGGDEQTEFDVILAAAGGQKIQVVKTVKDILGVGLKDAKDLVDGAPKPILEKASKADAEDAKAKLEEVGAEVELK